MEDPKLGEAAKRLSPSSFRAQTTRGTGHFVLIHLVSEFQIHSKLCVVMPAQNLPEALVGSDPLLTLAGPSIGRHGVASLWACTLVTPRHVDTAEGAEDAGTLSALVDVCQRERFSPHEPYLAADTLAVPATAMELRGPFDR